MQLFFNPLKKIDGLSFKTPTDAYYLTSSLVHGLLTFLCKHTGQFAPTLNKPSSALKEKPCPLL